MAIQNHQRKQVAVLAAELVRCSSIMGGKEPHAFDELRNLRKFVFELIAGKFNGCIIDFTAVGIVAEFTDVLDAVSCSVEIQSAVSSQNDKLPTTEWIGLRIAVSLDDVRVKDGKCFASTSDMAAEHRNLTESWANCSAATICKSIGVTLDPVHEDQRDQSVNEPTSTFLIRPSKRLVLRQKKTVVENSVPSMVILPFQNMIVDPEQECLADKITEELTDTVSESGKLRVISRSSTSAYKGGSVDVRQVASNLGVPYVLEGSVRLGGDKLRITGQLIEGDGGTLIWAERYDGELEDGSALQQQIAGAVVGAIETNIRTSTILSAQKARSECQNPFRVH